MASGTSTAKDTRRVERPGTFSKVEVIDRVPGEAYALRLKKDSPGEGITGACESKTPFVDQGISTVAGSEHVKRNWVRKADGNGCLMRTWARRWEDWADDGSIRGIFVDFDCIFGEREFGIPSTIDLSRVLIGLIEI
jgi:hypothetical protein